MAIVVDTDTVDEHERAEYWRRAQEELFFPVDFRPRADAHVAGRAYGHDLGPVQVRRVIAGPSWVVRTPRTIALADPERLELTMLLHGHQERTQDGRAATMRPGDITTVDTSRPFTVMSATPFEMLTFSIPKTLLTRDAERLLGSTAVPIGQDAGVAAVIGPFLRSVGDGLLDGRVGESDVAVGEGIIDLARGLYARRDPPRGSVALAQIQAAIEARLHDPHLDPSSIAGEHFISVRLLHKLFAQDGLTVSSWVRERRLERCRRDLADPALAGETVASIAMSWGFRNAGHFSRAYRAAYGRVPSEERGRGSVR
jgi:AraC-like DNA-binding protein